MKTVLEIEKGYSPNYKGDPETLFGITIHSWKAIIPKLTSAQLANAHPDIQKHFATISKATPAERHELTAQFMREIGQMLMPFGDQPKNPTSGLPIRTSEHPRKNISSANQLKFEAARDIASTIHFEEFARRQQFHTYPYILGDQAIRFSINSGPPRALCFVWKSLFEANIIDESTYHKLPPLTSSEANDKGIFATTKGSPYTKPEAFHRVAEALQSATDQQIINAADRFLVWQKVYYQVLAKEAPNMERYLEGWQNAAIKTHSEATGKKPTQYSSVKPSPQDAEALAKLITIQTAKIEQSSPKYPDGKDAVAIAKIITEQTAKLEATANDQRNSSLITKTDPEAVRPKSPTPMRFPVTDMKSQQSQTTQLVAADKPRSR